MFSSPFDQALSKPFLDQEETRSNREEPQLQNSFYRPPVQQYNDEEGLVRERHSDVAHIARSMAQIHDIQQGTLHGTEVILHFAKIAFRSCYFFRLGRLGGITAS
mmetsp:Transcript_32133/g.49116  ORF Transcript_32133/g.49116 Transcript_32133/m.49116 type:complete len:105 (-) Transcript_32133:255-569(-)